MSLSESPTAAWIDDEGSCGGVFTKDGYDRTFPICKGGLAHLYAVGPRSWAMRCPKSLSKDEQARVFYDSPPGSGRERVMEYRGFLAEQRQHRERRA